MRRQCLLLPLLGLMAACSAMPPQGRTPYTPSPAMEAVLRERQDMHAAELSQLSAADARAVPTLVAAARAMPNVRGVPAGATEVPQVTGLVATGAGGPLAARLYRPALAKDTPIILYFVGGTWVTGSLDEYEESARQLSVRTGWVVVSLRTRLAPEAQFPGEHDDAFALYEWARAHMREWGADPTRVVLAGEGPGANLAISTALLARDRARAGSPTPAPDHLLLITPVAGTQLHTASMGENSHSLPLTRSDVDWAQWRYARHDLGDPRIDVVDRSDLGGLPPTTMVLAPIDPLRSGGEALAAKLTAAGVPTQQRVFEGTTYGFFGLGLQVPEAAAAEDYAAAQLKTALYRPETPAQPTPRLPPRPTRRRAH